MEQKLYQRFYELSDSWSIETSMLWEMPFT